mmetsp:Transcript_16226/g.36497  ORF Transcript_16226/g.36497 Transcript_16226/m.36497 type:complete len:266 (+) Transcript_16226:362-1159(+)
MPRNFLDLFDPTFAMMIRRAAREFGMLPHHHELFRGHPPVLVRIRQVEQHLPCHDAGVHSALVQKVLPCVQPPVPVRIQPDEDVPPLPRALLHVFLRPPLQLRRRDLREFFIIQSAIAVRVQLTHVEHVAHERGSLRRCEQPVAVRVELREPSDQVIFPRLFQRGLTEVVGEFHEGKGAVAVGVHEGHHPSGIVGEVRGGEVAHEGHPFFRRDRAVAVGVQEDVEGAHLVACHRFDELLSEGGAGQESEEDYKGAREHLGLLFNV